MASPEWLFGPAGDLRPMPAPDVDMTTTVDRFGGTHTSITGAVTVDSLGTKSHHEFELPSLRVDEYERLEAMFTRLVPGPYYLVDPMRRNLLSREAATMRPIGANRRGVRVTAGSLNWIRITGGPTPLSQRGVRWNGAATSSYLYFDEGRRFPVTPGESVTSSVYVRPNQTVTLGLSLRCYTGGSLSASLAPAAVSCPANTWTRLTATAASGDLSTYEDVHPAIQYVSGGTTGLEIQVMAPQAEYASAVSDWSLGGGVQRVEIKELPATSPQYPYRTATLSLLEV